MKPLHTFEQNAIAYVVQNKYSSSSSQNYFIIFLFFFFPDLVIGHDGYYLTSVWCFVTWKWGFVLFLYSRLYKTKTEVAYSLKT